MRTPSLPYKTPLRGSISKPHSYYTEDGLRWGDLFDGQSLGLGGGLNDVLAQDAAQCGAWLSGSEQ